MIRVLIADDQALVRAGFRAILETQDDIEVAGEAGDGQEAIELARDLRPDVVLMDIRMPGLDGIEATRGLLGNDRAPKVLMLTTFDLDEYLYEAMRAGASGFLLKDVPREQLINAVRTVARGGRATRARPRPPPGRGLRPPPPSRYRGPTRGRGALRQGARGPETHRRRALERGNRQAALPQRSDSTHARRPHPLQASAP